MKLKGHYYTMLMQFKIMIYKDFLQNENFYKKVLLKYIVK
jgi:hypothetical protein